MKTILCLILFCALTAYGQSGVGLRSPFYSASLKAPAAPAGGCNTLIGDYNNGNGNALAFGSSPSNVWAAAQFRASNTTHCKLSADLYYNSSNASTYTVGAYLYSDSGANTPLSCIVTSSTTYIIGQLSPSAGIAYKAFDFPSTNLTPGTLYWLVFKASTDHGTYYYKMDSGLTNAAQHLCISSNAVDWFEKSQRYPDVKAYGP